MFQFAVSAFSYLCHLLVCASVAAAVIFSGNIKDSYYRDYVGQAVVRILNVEKTGGGTGFHIEAESGKTYILTNAHICAVAKDGKLLVQSGEQEMVRNVIKVYEQHDLCLVEALPDPKYVLEVAGSLDDGDDIVVVGHPGLRDLTLAHGEFIGQDEIKMLNPEIEDQAKCSGKWVQNPMLLLLFGREGVCLETFVTSAISSPIYGGNSGSPVINKYGNVVGVVFAGSDQVNDGHAVPLSNVKDFLKGF